jgi:dynein heavy chain, axonemal
MRYSRVDNENDTLTMCLCWTICRHRASNTTTTARLHSDLQDTLQRLQACDSVRTACSRSGLVPSLEVLSDELERCKYSLKEYLASKRKLFPRFYFISEAELLDLLAVGGDVSTVLRHVTKLLPATRSITLQPAASTTSTRNSGSNALVTAVITTDGEPQVAAIAAAAAAAEAAEAAVDVARPLALQFAASVGIELIDFEAPVQLDGGAEQYLAELLQQQRRALGASLRRSLARYPTQSRVDWLLHPLRSRAPKQKHKATAAAAAAEVAAAMTLAASQRREDPAQIALLCAAVQACSEAESALKRCSDGDATALPAYAELLSAQLQQLGERARSEMTPADRQRLCCLIAHDAHARDVAVSLLQLQQSSTGTPSVSDFEWRRHLKLRCVDGTGSGTGKGGKRKAGAAAAAALLTTMPIVQLEICGAVLQYGFDYQGNGSRLIITPLTDRVYVAALQAMKLGLCCALTGHAGTGKSEMIKVCTTFI